MWISIFSWFDIFSLVAFNLNGSVWCYASHLLLGMVLELSCHSRLSSLYTVKSHLNPTEPHPFRELPVNRVIPPVTSQVPMRKRRRTTLVAGLSSNEKPQPVGSRRATIDPAYISTSISSSRVTRRSSIDPFPTASTRRSSLEPSISITKRASKRERCSGDGSNSTSPLTLEEADISLRAVEDFDFKVCRCMISGHMCCLDTTRERL